MKSCALAIQQVQEARQIILPVCVCLPSDFDSLKLQQGQSSLSALLLELDICLSPL